LGPFAPSGVEGGPGEALGRRAPRDVFFYVPAVFFDRAFLTLYQNTDDICEDAVEERAG